jgi:hypothetical protein
MADTSGKYFTEKSTIRQQLFGVRWTPWFGRLREVIRPGFAKLTQVLSFGRVCDPE